MMCLVLMMTLGTTLLAQDKIYLVKGNAIIATYSLDQVDYMTFDNAGLDVAGEFDITVTEVGYNSLEWNVIPNDPEMYYYSAIYTVDSLRDRFHYSVDEMASALFNDMTFLAGMVGMDAQEFMTTHVLVQGEADFYYDQLNPDTEYMVVAYGCSPEGVATTDSYTAVAQSTKAMELNGLKVEFDIDNASNDVTIVATPNDPDIRYLVQVRSVAEGFGMQDYMNTLLWRGNISGLSPEQVVENNTAAGVQTFSYNLEPDTDYIVYAASFTPEGIVNSEISTQNFTSGSVLPSDNTFTLTVYDISQYKAQLQVVPSNSDLYCMGYFKSELIEGMTDEEILNKWIDENQYYLDWFMASGERTYTLTMDSDTEYTAFVFGYNMGVVTTPITKTTLKSLPPSDPATWECSYGDITMGTYYGDPAAYVTINVNQEDVRYLWGVVESYGTEEQVQEALLYQWDRYAGWGMNYVTTRSIWGTNEVSFAGFEGGMSDTKTYKFYAVVMNADTAEFETPVFFSEVFDVNGPVNEADVKAAVKAATEKNADAPIHLYEGNKNVCK